MNNKEFISTLAERLGYSADETQQLVDIVTQTMGDRFQDDDSVIIPNFGTFEVRTRKGREKARNPKTGELVAVDTHGVAVFRPGKELKDLVWDLRQEN